MPIYFFLRRIIHFPSRRFALLEDVVREKNAFFYGQDLSTPSISGDGINRVAGNR
jgi:hypothetical protein